MTPPLQPRLAQACRDMEAEMGESGWPAWYTLLLLLASPGSSCSRTEGWVLAGRLPREGGLLPPSSPLSSPTSLRQGALTRCPSTRLFLEARATRSASNRAQPYLIRLLRLLAPLVAQQPLAGEDDGVRALTERSGGGRGGLVRGAEPRPGHGVRAGQLGLRGQLGPRAVRSLRSVARLLQMSS